MPSTTIKEEETSNFDWLGLLSCIHIISLHKHSHKENFLEGIKESTQDDLGHGNILLYLLHTLME